MRISDWSSDVCSSDLFVDGQTAQSLGLDGTEVFDFDGLDKGATEVSVTARKADGKTIEFKAKVRINTAKEWEYYAHGRSEEHTSELQSLMRISYAVFCLKKKIRTKQSNKSPTIQLKQ